jgi:hypothetical protein
MIGMNMTRLISKTIITLLSVLLLTSCEKPLIDLDADDGNVVLTFQPVSKDNTRGSAANYFDKLNVQMFDAEGEKIFDQVKTQEKTDDDFCTMSLKLTAGTYWVVAVGHSSKRSVTIKSPESVQFTASDGEKLTDTFCHCSQITIGGDYDEFSLDMYRVGAMIQFCFTDEHPPVNWTHVRIDYTGGSANFNPQTLEGNTKSTQSEKRATNGIHVYQCFTFPYMAASCYLKMTVTGLDMDGTTIRKRVFENVPVTRNRITTFTGRFFMDGDGEFTQSDFGFVVHTDWDGEDNHDF